MGLFICTAIKEVNDKHSSYIKLYEREEDFFVKAKKIYIYNNKKIDNSNKRSCTVISYVNYNIDL